MSPPVIREEKEGKEKRTRDAVREAQRYDGSLSTVWTDGSKLDSGGVSCAVAWYEEAPHRVSPPPTSGSTDEERLASGGG